MVIGVRRHHPLADLEALLHLFEPRIKFAARQAADSELIVPIGQRLFWRAKAGGPVDHCGAAYGAALQDGNAAIFGGAGSTLLVEVTIGFALIHIKLIAAF